MVTTLPSVGNSTIIGLIQYINDVSTGGWLGLSLLLLFGLISFLALKSYITEKALVASSFITLLMSILLVGLGILEIHWVTVIFSILAISVFMALLSKRNQ